MTDPRDRWLRKHERRLEREASDTGHRGVPTLFRCSICHAPRINRRTYGPGKVRHYTCGSIFSLRQGIFLERCDAMGRALSLRMSDTLPRCPRCNRKRPELEAPLVPPPLVWPQTPTTTASTSLSIATPGTPVSRAGWWSTSHMREQSPDLDPCEVFARDPSRYGGPPSTRTSRCAWPLKPREPIHRVEAC